MGYYIFSFAIDTDKIRESIGSKNSELFAEVLASDAFELYSEQDFEGHTTTREALEQLIFGKPYNEKSAHAYWYAFIALCSYLGESLDEGLPGPGA